MKRDAMPRQVQKEQTRARLVEAALAVFAERGFQDATVDDVSAAAGHSKGAFYFHFNSKEELFLELLGMWVTEQTARLRAFDDAVPAAALLEGLEAFLSYEGRDITWAPLVLEFWAQGQRDGGLQGALQRAYGTWQRLLTQAFRRAAREGVLEGAVPADIAARTVLAAHDGLLVEACLDPQAAQGGSLRRLLGSLLQYLASGAPEVLLEAAPATPPARAAARRPRRRPPAA